jgi:hypothetical protein
MKNIMKNYCNNRKKSIFRYTLLNPGITASFTLARKGRFQTSTVPAARGDVKVTKDENKNYLIQIKLENLAEVKRLDSSNEAYVVWMETDDSMVKNIGQIKSDSNFYLLN